MPNYVSTRLSFNCKNKERINELFYFVKNDESDFDFNKVIPVPEDLNIESSTRGENGMKYITLKGKHPILWSEEDRSFMQNMQKMEKENPDKFNETIDLGKKYLMNLANYGFTTWYEANIHWWGTQWNACNPCADRDAACVEFETAWSFALPVVIELSKKFPDVEISYIFADEDCGCNTGRGVLLDGEHIEEDYPDDCSNEAYGIVLELHPEYEDELVYDPETDSYKWIDQDDE